MNLSNIELPSNRKFGFFFTVIFMSLGTYFYLHQSYLIMTTFYIIAILFFLLTLIWADLLLPLNKLWMRFGLLLNFIVSPIILGVIFFGVFTPIGLIMRLFGRDELLIKPSRKKSFWKNKNINFIQQHSFENQF